MFLPYRAGIAITRIPVMTIVVTAVCLLVFWAQDRNEQRIVASAQGFCSPEVAAEVERGQKTALHSDLPCWAVLSHVYGWSDPERHLRWHIEKIEASGDHDAAVALDRDYHAFAAQAPPYLTERLVQYAGSWNPIRMLTAVVAHASWDHVIGNLFFFVAFAMVVETVVGPVLFLVVFLALALGSGALENLLTTRVDGGSGLGLSGVVMGFMTLAAYFSPRVKIKFFYFFFLFVGVLSWPLWSVAAWWVFWNIWDYVFWRDVSGIGFAAHLAGAAVGLILGVTLFRGKRHWVAEHLVVDEPSLRDDESWLTKFNAIAATPVVMYFVFIYGLAAFVITTWLIVTFIKTFAVQMLLAAPAVAAAMQLWRLKRAPTPLWERYQKGLKALAAHRFQEAQKVLTPLAEGGYPRAQLALARAYAQPGGLWNPAEAFRWLEAAAKRGLAEAQHEIGVRCLHGHEVPKDPARAIEWLEKAAAQGLGQAAQSLGHLYENLRAGAGDRDRAIEWYYRAAVAFRKSGRTEDARAMIRHLESLADKYPTVRQLIAKLEQLVPGEPRRPDSAER